jgi:hypothetical protein
VRTFDFTLEYPPYPDTDGQFEQWLNAYRAGGVPVDRKDLKGMTRLVFRFPDPRMVIEFVTMTEGQGAADHCSRYLVSRNAALSSS